MRKALSVIALLALAGCDYTVPLVKQPDAPIDNALVGLWQRTKPNGDEERLLVLPLGPREYLVSYPAQSSDAMFARACLARAADRPLIQLQWFGTAKGAQADDNRVFQYATYTAETGRLTVRLLNTDVVKKTAASTTELAEAVAASRDHPDLFREAMIFTKTGE